MPNDSPILSPILDANKSDNATAANSAANAATAEALKQAQSPDSPRKRGRPPGSAGGGASVDKSTLKTAAAQLDALAAPEIWESLLALPGDVAATMTAHDHWTVSKDERKTLGLTGAAVARTMMIQDPRSLAIILLASSLVSVYGTRFAKEIALRKIETVTGKKNAD